MAIARCVSGLFVPDSLHRIEGGGAARTAERPTGASTDASTEATVKNTAGSDGETPMGSEAMMRAIWNAGGEAKSDSRGDLPQAAGHHQGKYVAHTGAESHASPHSARAAGGSMSHYGIDAHRGHQQADKREAEEQFAEQAEEPYFMFRRLDRGGRCPSAARPRSSPWTAVRTGWNWVRGSPDHQRHVIPALPVGRGRRRAAWR